MPRRKVKTDARPHDYVMITIRRAEVDKLMAPLVRKLNKFPAVETYACCQGYKKITRAWQRPYVCLKLQHAFTEDLDEVMLAIQKAKNKARARLLVTVTCHELDGTSFNLTFDSQDDLKAFTKAFKVSYL